MSTKKQKQKMADEKLLPFIMDHLPDYVRKKCEVELKETSENKLMGLLELKRLLSEEQTTKDIDFEKDLLIQHLRHSKYDATLAFNHLKNYVALRKKQEDMFRSMPEDSFLTKKSSKFIIILPRRCPEGCTVAAIRIGKFDPSESSFDDFLRQFTMVFLQALRDPMVQVNGFKIIYDFEGIKLEHLKFATPGNLYLMYHTGVDCVPLRYKSFHFINQNIIFRAMWPAIKAILSEKIRNRIYSHSKPTDLLEHFPSSILPVEYGGDLHDIDMTDWLRNANKEHKNYTVAGQPNWF